MKIDSDKFILEIQKRKIEYLIHFTPTKNLYSILEQQEILSRELLENLDIEQFDILDYIQFTDEIRYDDKDYINLSISGPNTFLFSKFRQKTVNDPTINWCVLKIKPIHIYDTDTLFSVSNAASNASKKQYGISGDFNKFQQLFIDSLELNTFNGIRTIIRDKGLKSHFTTDVQAEVLVKSRIPYTSILEVCFQDNNDLAQAKAAMCDFDTTKFKIDSKIFSPERCL